MDDLSPLTAAQIRRIKPCFLVAQDRVMTGGSDQRDRPCHQQRFALA